MSAGEQADRWQRGEAVCTEEKAQGPTYRRWECHVFLYYKTGGYINTVKVSKH